MRTIRTSFAQWFSGMGIITFVFSAVALMMAFVAPASHASNPTGIYAFVDKVVLEPSDTAPERRAGLSPFQAAAG